MLPVRMRDGHHRFPVVEADEMMAAAPLVMTIEDVTIVVQPSGE